MSWTEEHDTLLCREILAVDPFDTKKGTAQRGDKWKTIADNLMAIAAPKFKVEARSVRDRYRLLSQRVKRKLNDEMKASGIETDSSEWEIAVEELLEKERECDSAYDADTENKYKAREEEKETAEGIRQKAMERLGKQKRSPKDDSEVRPPKRRSNGSDTLLYLKERNESMEKCKMQELELKKRELEIQEKKQDMLEKRNDNLMQMMLTQQQQQAKQMQDFQAMMLGMITRMSQK